MGWLKGHSNNITQLILLTLKQGKRLLENYIQEYLAIAHYSDLPDSVLIEFFCDGINIYI